MLSDFRLLAFCRILALGGVGQTDKVLLAFVKGLLSGRFVALFAADEDGSENAMLRHLSRVSLDLGFACKGRIIKATVDYTHTHVWTHIFWSYY